MTLEGQEGAIETEESEVVVPSTSVATGEDVLPTSAPNHGMC